MSDSLGLSIGMTNLVAARIGRAPVMRRSVLTLFNDRAPEVGVPGENPNLNQPGLVLSGFVERVGDPVPLVAADGSPHRGERVLVEALDAMARTVGGGAPIAIAVPAHWGPGTVGALRGALRAKPSLAPNGVPAALIPDSVAALAALQAAPGLPSSGIVALGRPGRQRDQHHAGRRRLELRPDRRDGPVSRLLRRPDRPGTAQPCGRPESPKPTTPIPPARWGSDRWPGCATRPGRPRNGCPPRRRRWCPPSCPASTPTSG